MAGISKRHGRIQEILDSGGTVNIATHADRLHVSAETVRRALRPLAARGSVIRMHGAVGLAGTTGEAPFQRRMSENAGARMRIARAAAAMIRNADSLLLDTGFATSFLARTLAGRQGNRVFLVGGRINGDAGAVLGAEAVEAVRAFRVDHAIISAGAMPSEGVMDFDPEEAAFARAVLGCGRRRIVVTDAAKFGRDALVMVCALSEIDDLVTDCSAPPDLAAALGSAGTRVTLAS